MPLPAAVVQVLVHGKILDPLTGAAGVGYVDFRMPQAVVDTADKAIIGSGTFRATLDTAGEFTISLLATTTPGFVPADWAYEARVYTNVWRVEKLLVKIPHTAPGTLEFTDLIA